MTTESDRPFVRTNPRIRIDGDLCDVGIDSSNSYRISLDETGRFSGVRQENQFVVFRPDDPAERRLQQSYFGQFTTAIESDRTTAIAGTTTAQTTARLDAVIAAMSGVTATRANPYDLNTNTNQNTISSLSVEKYDGGYKITMSIQGVPSNRIFLSDSIRAAMLEVASVLINQKLASDY